MKIALAQLNPLVGDLSGNAELIFAACQKASTKNANFLLTPELSLWGYPPRDLLLNSRLFDLQTKILDTIAQKLYLENLNIGVFIGIAELIHDTQLPNLFNSMVFVENNSWKVVARKQLLPSYDVFDEKRYFRPSEDISTLTLKIDHTNWDLGLTICEDLWVEDSLQNYRTAGPDPIKELESHPIDLLINFSASPFSQNKSSIREALAIKAAKRLNCPVIYLNQIGGNDELIFDGSSFIINSNSEVALRMPLCHESIAYWEFKQSTFTTNSSLCNQKEELFEALTLGVRDYARKCGFSSAIIGLSGGIDSALVTTIATAALGPEAVLAVLMPSPWSSDHSVKDALELAKRLGIKTHTIAIKELMKTFDSALKVPLSRPLEGIAAENLQSRIRGTILMALANQQGHLLLSTGNKSELAVGYCTLYGDMNGGLSVIGDLYKTCVFDLCRWIDSDEAGSSRSDCNLPISGALIGNEIINKAPSAELRPNQMDTDSLPDYAILDPILQALIEDKCSPEGLIKSGQDEALVKQIETLIKKAEFKRRQAPPLLKVSNQAFGSGWRVPIAAK